MDKIKISKKTISGLMTVVFIFSIYVYRVQAVVNNPLGGNIKNDKSGTKSRIMSNFKKNKGKKNFKEGEIIVKIKTSTNNSLSGSLNGSSVRSSVESTIESVNKKYGVKTKKKINRQLDVVKFDNKKYSTDEVLQSLNNDPNIEYAEPNYISKLASYPTTEPYFGKMWGLNNTKSQGIDINVLNAWKISTGNPKLVVGVIDTGIDYKHEDLKNNIWVNSKDIPGNGIDDDKDGYVDDYNGWDFVNSNNDSTDDNSHGTHISGTIAASSNGVGTVGIAPNVKIMALKVADGQGDLYDSDVISAIEYGTSHGVKLFNCSFSGVDFSQTEYDAFKNSDALFMCAAGNGDDYGNGMNNDSSVKSYPASFDLPNIISVASIGSNGQLSTFSNYGAVSVDIAAPGNDIYSTVPGGYDYKSGTSMATPQVTGVAALVMSENMNLTPIDIKNCILKGSNRLPQLYNKIATGAIVDAFDAMAEAQPSLLVKLTDVTGNGITDINDLNLVKAAYNSRTGDLLYKKTLDMNNDGIINVYDLVRVSKAMQ